MREEAIPVKVLKDDNEYRIWGLHFFNVEKRISEYKEDIEKLLGV